MTARFSSISTIFGFLLATLLVGCGSAQKQRLELREKMAASSGMYCEFISGDVHNDIDVELNLQMARRCEPTKPLSITNYKNSSENYGVIYCCSVRKDETKKDETKKDDKKMGLHPTVPPTKNTDKNTDELDLSDGPSDLPADKKSDKPALPAKVNPSTLNNPAVPASKPAAAPAAAKPPTTSPSPSAANKPASAAPSTTSASAKPASTSAPQNTAPKAPNKTPDTPETDILGE